MIKYVVSCPTFRKNLERSLTFIIQMDVNSPIWFSVKTIELNLISLNQEMRCFKGDLILNSFFELGNFRRLPRNSIFYQTLYFLSQFRPLNSFSSKNSVCKGSPDSTNFGLPENCVNREILLIRD